jgi:hypothetical protein
VKIHELKWEAMRILMLTFILKVWNFGGHNIVFHNFKDHFKYLPYVEPCTSGLLQPILKWNRNINSWKNLDTNIIASLFIITKNW